MEKKQQIKMYLNETREAKTFEKCDKKVDKNFVLMKNNSSILINKLITHF